MPTNKRESLLFTFIMCFCMVMWMSFYNVSIMQGAPSLDALAAAWMGFPPAYAFAMLCDWFVASPIAKGVAFRFFVKPGSSPRIAVLAVSTCMVVPMVTIMSLYGAVEAALHLPGGILGALPMIPAMWLRNIGLNFVMALPWNLLVAGPVARTVFRRAFPVGTVLQHPVEAEPSSTPAAAGSSPVKA